MTAAVKPGPGRPRDPRRDEAILDAAVVLLAEGGLARMSMDLLASAATAGKATIYRRWPTREHVLADVLTRRPPCVTWPEPGPDPLFRDLLAVLRAFTTGPRAGAGLALLSQLPHDDGLRAAYRAGHLTARGEAMVELGRRQAYRTDHPVEAFTSPFWPTPVLDTITVLQHKVLHTGVEPDELTLITLAGQLTDRVSRPVTP